MQEIELYNLYHWLSIASYVLGAVFIAVAVVFLIKGFGGIKEILERMKPKPSMKAETEEEEAQEHLQKVADAIEAGQNVKEPDPGTEKTEPLESEEDAASKTTVLQTHGPDAKFRITRKIIITHAKEEPHV